MSVPGIRRRGLYGRRVAKRRIGRRPIDHHCLPEVRIKHLQRENRIHEASRHETVAEHCWHVSLLAMLCEPFAPSDIDQAHVRELLVIHDLVEVYAGDTVLWADAVEADVAAREAAAGKRLVNQLPAMMRDRFSRLIEEFQAQDTQESRYARALDSLHPMLLSWGPGGKGHVRTTLTATSVLVRKSRYLESFPPLWDLAQQIVADAVARGLLRSG